MKTFVVNQILAVGFGGGRRGLETLRIIKEMPE
jgi:hypothetical protein